MLVLVLVVGIFTACGNKAEEPKVEEPAPVADAEKTEAPEASGDEEVSVALITMDQMDQHWVAVNDGAEKAAAELGNVKLTWMAPDVKDDAKQIEAVNNAVAGGAQVLLVAANGPDAITSALEQAAADNVKIIYVDSPANFPAEQTLATDNKAAGKTAGEKMLEKLTADGVTSGKIGVVNVNASTDSVVAREAGFREAFEGTDFEILETQYSEGDIAASKDAAANYITQGVVGIYGTNEGTTVGVGNAIKEAGADVVGVGFDKSEVALELIEEGFLLAIMAQNPDVMGYEGVKTAVIVAGGNAPATDAIDTGVSVITAENLADFQ